MRTRVWGGGLGGDLGRDIDCMTLPINYMKGARLWGKRTFRVLCDGTGAVGVEVGIYFQQHHHIKKAFVMIIRCPTILA
jgi:hypothetical protein